MKLAAAICGLWAFGSILAVDAYDPTDTLMNGGMYETYFWARKVV
jgi:hypothetical protein